MVWAVVAEVPWVILMGQEALLDGPGAGREAEEVNRGKVPK